MEWKYTSLSRTKKFKSVPSDRKVKLILFWDFNMPILEHYQYHGKKASNAWYCAMKLAIHSKHRGLLTNGAVLNRDNVQPLWQKWPMKWFRNWNFSFYPIWLIDQTSSHIFTIFMNHAKMLCGWWFANDDEVKDAVHMWFHVQPKTFFADGIRKLTPNMTLYLFLCTFCRKKKIINWPYFLNSPCLSGL
jgi:hypothetical protein